MTDSLGVGQVPRPIHHAAARSQFLVLRLHLFRQVAPDCVVVLAQHLALAGLHQVAKAFIGKNISEAIVDVLGEHCTREVAEQLTFPGVQFIHVLRQIVATPEMTQQKKKQRQLRQQNQPCLEQNHAAVRGKFPQNKPDAAGLQQNKNGDDFVENPATHLAFRS